MCDSNNNEVFDHIHNIASHLLSEIVDDISDETKKRLRHGLNLIISLSGFREDLVTQEDLDILGMGSHKDHHAHDHSHDHSHNHPHKHSHDHSHDHPHKHPHEH